MNMMVGLSGFEVIYKKGLLYTQLMTFIKNCIGSFSTRQYVGETTLFFSALNLLKKVNITFCQSVVYEEDDSVTNIGFLKYGSVF